MNKYKKITEEMKEKIISMRQSGLTLREIGERFKVSTATVAYHSDEEQRQKSIARSIKNAKPRDRKEYNRKYQADRYKNDEAYRERIKKDNRVNKKKRYWEKNGKSNNIS